MPHGPLGERIPFEGVLNCWNDDHDLPDLLLAISRSGKTGRLHFSNPEGDKTLDLHDGKIVFAESSSQDDGLGQYLLRTGKISLMDYNRVAKMVQPGKRLGELLVDSNVLPRDELVPAVVGQVRAIVLGLFRRTETWYRFKEEERPPAEAITLDLAVPELILEGVRYVESWRRVSKGVGNLDSMYHQATARQAEWEASHLDDDVAELVSMLSTPTSLADICTHATLPDFEACRYLWAFRSLGWIDLVEQREIAARTVENDAPAPTPTPTPEPAPKPAPAETPPAAATPTQADTPTMPSIERPAPKPIPQELLETQISMDGAAETTEQPDASIPPPSPREIPERLIETQVSMSPPQAPAPPVSDSAELPAPRPVPQHLNETQLSVEPPSATPPEPPKAIREELLHTQMYVDAPGTATDGEPAPSEPAPPPSTGEFMESILEGDDPERPATPVAAEREVAPPPPAPEPAAPPPDAPANHATTQFFDGPSALEPPALATAPAPPEPPQPPSPEPPGQAVPTPSPPVEAPTPTSATTPPGEAPSGFEALMGGGPDPLSTPPPPTPPRTTPSPSPADVATQPTVRPVPAEPPAGDGAMASFSDLALPEEPASAPVPTVEADVVAAEPEESLLPPPVGGPAVTRESLIPRRRNRDESDLDNDEFGHLLNDPK